MLIEALYFLMFILVMLIVCVLVAKVDTNNKHNHFWDEQNQDYFD